MPDTLHGDHRAVTAAQMSRLEGWAGRKPCVALMGEFSAGKTTLINFLVGEDVLPTRVTATQLPPVWLSHGEPAAHYIDTGGQRHELALDALHEVPVEGVRHVRLFCRGGILETIDLIDTPGLSDPNIPRRTWEVAVGYVNAVLWCTHATQAWRETERGAWESLPERLRANSVLLATRSDKLNLSDRARVAQRLARETAGLFRDVVMFSATDAIRASAEPEAEAGDLWRTSGGAELLAALEEIAAEIAARRKAMLARYAVIESRAAPVRLHVVPNRVGRGAEPVRPADPARTRPGRAEAEALRLRMLSGGAAEAAAGADIDSTETADTAAGEGALRLGTPAWPVLPADPGAARDAEAAADAAGEAALADGVGTDAGSLGAEAVVEDTAAAAGAEAAEVAEDAVAEVRAAETGPGDGAVALWRRLLARGKRPETVDEVLALIEDFLAAGGMDGRAR